MVEILPLMNWLVSAESRGVFLCCTNVRRCLTWHAMLLGLFMDYFCSSESTWHVTFVLLYVFMVFVV